MSRPRAMRFHASLGAAHDFRGLGNVQFLPVTHDESLTLTLWQALQLLLNDLKYLGLLKLLQRRVWPERAVRHLEGLERVAVVVLGTSAERREQRSPQRAHLLAAEPVAHRVLQDAMKEKRQF